MIADAIRFILSNLPSILTLIAFCVVLAIHKRDHTGTHQLSWLLLLAVGIDGVWAGIFHVFFPAIASAQIGWLPSPFETEIGIADLAMGVVAITAFWCSRGFKCAIALYAILFYIGTAMGHISQALTAGDFAPDNIGPLLIATLLRTLLLIYLLNKIRRTG
ncbi:DUF6790 family protein [Brucella pseudogrignonensis]|uniref:DUF6790 family protein n=1 Tax=Brucella pseudogrignonensis TaxID=419475 RepID=UPI00124D6C54|nr:DUF6790 family protein [Brucella pseudogrignonensis]KAB2685875.1 hypothetical protein F9K82_21860 [Brucella pseudogrignonensis]